MKKLVTIALVLLVSPGFLASLGLFTGPADAQAPSSSLSKRVESVDEGRVLMSFDARPGVYGDGESVCTFHSNDEWKPGFENGPVRVSLRIEKGQVVRLRTYVGGEWTLRGKKVEDLGTVPASEAAEFLLSLAAKGDTPAAEEAIFPATLADGVEVWPRLMDIARDDSRPDEVRRSAVFWVGQEAARAVTEELSDLALDDEEDLEVREHAVFALSQRPDDEAVPSLMRVARSDLHPELRESALFWLAQKDDPRVLNLFEEILTARD